MPIIERSELIFLGTGTSGGVPDLGCLADVERKCKTCWQALEPNNRNRRFNTSIVIRTFYEEDGVVVSSRNILIDCGKYFCASALKTFVKENVDHLDALIITHAHADAFFGIDDLRDFANLRDTGKVLKVFVREEDVPELKRTFPYLMNQGQTTNGMHIPALAFHIYPRDGAFEVCGLPFYALPVAHGPGVESTALCFGGTLYCSDLNAIPISSLRTIFNLFNIPNESQEALVALAGPPAMDPLNGQTNSVLPQNSTTSSTANESTDSNHSTPSSNDSIIPIPQSFPLASQPSNPYPTNRALELLILDALWPFKSYNSHFSLLDAIAHFRLMRPKKGFTTGMSHEIEYTEFSQYIARVSLEHKLDLELAYDGLVVPISLD